MNHQLFQFGKAFRENFITLIVSALGFVAALSWNDAIRRTVEVLFPVNGDLVYKYLIAIIVTVIAITIIFFVSKLKPKQ